MVAEASWLEIHLRYSVFLDRYKDYACLGSWILCVGRVSLCKSSILPGVQERALDKWTRFFPLHRIYLYSSVLLHVGHTWARISWPDGDANSSPKCNIAVLAGFKVAPDSTVQKSTLIALLLVQRPLHRSAGMLLDCSEFQEDNELKQIWIPKKK